MHYSGQKEAIAASFVHQEFIKSEEHQDGQQMLPELFNKSIFNKIHTLHLLKLLQRA